MRVVLKRWPSDPEAHGANCKEREARRGALPLLLALFCGIACVGGWLVIETVAGVGDSLSEQARRQTKARYLVRGAGPIIESRLGKMLRAGASPASLRSVFFGEESVRCDWKLMRRTEPQLFDDGLHGRREIWRVRVSAEVEGEMVEERQLWSLRTLPYYQFARYQDGDMLLAPESHTTIRGAVHTNGDLWVSAGQAGIVFDTNYVRVRRTLHHRPPYAGPAGERNVAYRRWVRDPFDPAEVVEFEAAETRTQLSRRHIDSGPGGFDDEFRDVEESFMIGALDRWREPTGYPNGSGHTLLTGQHGTSKILGFEREELLAFVPSEQGSWNFDAARARYQEVELGEGTHDRGHYHSVADLVLLLGPGRRWSAFDGDGNEVTDDLAGYVRWKSFFDAYSAEEAGELSLTLEIDLTLLASAGFLRPGSVVFGGALHDAQASGMERRSFRLANGAEIATDFTFATSLPVYLLGDFNVKEPKCIGILCERLNLLSNAWDDGKAWDEKVEALDTEWHCAVLCADPAESYEAGPVGLFAPFRFHENWRWPHRTATFSGAIACAFAAQQPGLRHRVGGHFYDPPSEVFQFDERYGREPRCIPPQSPFGIQVRRLGSVRVEP